MPGVGAGPADAGGWLVRRNVANFARYAEFAAKHLGDRVRWWLTINEPTVYAKNAFVSGRWPPCRTGDWIAAWRALRNMNRGHRLAYDILHHYRSDALVGFAHGAPLVVPRAPARMPDRMDALLRDFILNRLPFQLMGGGSRKRLDFIGVNYYCRTVVYWQLDGTAALFGRDWLENDQGEPRMFSDIGWEIYPSGPRQQVRRFARYGVPLDPVTARTATPGLARWRLSLTVMVTTGVRVGRPQASRRDSGTLPDLVVTENGLATRDERLREEVLRAHLRSLVAVIAEGIPVAGSCYWTLMDNYEWSLGTTPRFGLAAIDFETQRRMPRPAAAYFAEVYRRNALPADASDGCRQGRTHVAGAA